MKIVFNIMLLVLFSSHSIANETQFGLVKAELIKYFNYNIGKDKVLSSTKIWIGGNCDKNGSISENY